MLYLVEKHALDHWRTLSVVTDKDKALATYGRLRRDQGRERLRLVACVNRDERGNKRIEILDEHRPPSEVPPESLASSSAELSSAESSSVVRAWPGTPPPAPLPPAVSPQTEAVSPEPVSPEPASIEPNVLRAFVYTGLAAGFVILSSSNLDYVTARLRAGGGAAAGVPGTVATPSPAREDGALVPSVVAEAPPAILETPPAVVEAPVSSASPPPMPAPALPAAQPRIELVAFLTDRATDGSSSPPPAVASAEPPPAPEADPAATAAAVAAPDVAIAPVPAPPPEVAAPAPAAPLHVRAHAACQAQMFRRARFKARALASTNYEWEQGPNSISLKGRDVEFKNVFEEWMAAHYRCRYDSAIGAVSQLDLQLSRK